MVEVRNVGLNVRIPTSSCTDELCPFHGRLTVRGNLFTGVAIKKEMKNGLVVRREYVRYNKKYKRHERRRKNLSAHCPPCLGVSEGDTVRIAECRPLSKTISFVVIEKMEGVGAV